MLPPGENAGNADEQTADAGVRDMLSFLIAVLELLLGDREQGGPPGVRRGTRRQGEVSSRPLARQARARSLHQLSTPYADVHPTRPLLRQLVRHAVEPVRIHRETLRAQWQRR